MLENKKNNIFLSFFFSSSSNYYSKVTILLLYFKQEQQKINENRIKYSVTIKRKYSNFASWLTIHNRKNNNTQNQSKTKNKKNARATDGEAQNEPANARYTQAIHIAWEAQKERGRHGHRAENARRNGKT